MALQNFLYAQVGSAKLYFVYNDANGKVESVRVDNTDGKRAVRVSDIRVVGNEKHDVAAASEIITRDLIGADKFDLIADEDVPGKLSTPPDARFVATLEPSAAPVVRGK